MSYFMTTGSSDEPCNEEPVYANENDQSHAIHCPKEIQLSLEILTGC